MVESVPVEIIRKTGELAIVAYNGLGAAKWCPFMRPRIERGSRFSQMRRKARTG